MKSSRKTTKSKRKFRTEPTPLLLRKARNLKK